MAQALDFFLEVELLALQLGELQVVGGAVRLLIVNLSFESAVPSLPGARNESCFSAVMPVIGWNQCV